MHQNGIYWGLHRVAHDYYKKNKPNTLLALQVIVNPDYKGYGLSYSCVKELINFGREKGYQRLVIPLRPSMKHMYPLMDIEKYMRWNNDDGFPYDPWLRVHVKLGGRLIKPCKGVTVEGLIEEWEKWTGLKFPYSCEYTIPQALNTINVNVINRTIVYAQDNVWVVHNLA